VTGYRPGGGRWLRVDAPTLVALLVGVATDLAGHEEAALAGLAALGPRECWLSVEVAEPGHVDVLLTGAAWTSVAGALASLGLVVDVDADGLARARPGSGASARSRVGASARSAAAEAVVPSPAPTGSSARR
jgi:hypothetical protein